MSCSDIDFREEANYKDAYLPWLPRQDRSCADIRVFVQPRLCTWRFITSNDAVYLKERQRDKRAILSFFGKVFPDNTTSVQGDDGFFAKIAWKMFKFLRDESFSAKGISAALGLVYTTHMFFLSSPEHTPKDVYKFFYDGVFLHTVLDPPECDEVFTVAECESLFELFRNVYLQNIRLLHLTHFLNYYRASDVSASPASVSGEAKATEAQTKNAIEKRKPRS